MSTTVNAVRAHPDMYKKDFDAVVTFLTKYINKKAPTPSVKVASIRRNRPGKRQKTYTAHFTVKEKIELNEYLREENDSMTMAEP